MEPLSLHIGVIVYRVQRDKKVAQLDLGSARIKTSYATFPTDPVKPWHRRERHEQIAQSGKESV